MLIYARQLGARSEDAEDLVHDTLEVSLRDAAWYDPSRSQLLTVLKRVLKHRIIDRWRSASNKQRAAPALRIVAPPPSPEVPLFRQRAATRRRAFLSMLTTDERRLFQAWLDAFSLKELLHPELKQLDQSVDQELKRLGVEGHARVDGPPGSRHKPRPNWGLALRPVWGLAALSVLAAGVIIGLAIPRDTPKIVAPESLAAQQQLSAPPLPTREPARASGPDTPERSTPAPLLPAAQFAPSQPKSSPLPPHKPDVVIVSEPLTHATPLLPGLRPLAGAQFEIHDGDAVLLSGLISYRHDATHDPGVAKVRWANVPVVASPRGTAFVSAAAPEVAALAVSEGWVDLDHRDGSLLKSLWPGQELVVIVDPDKPHGVQLIVTTSMPLDLVRASVPSACHCQADVVAAVARLRLVSLRGGP